MALSKTPNITGHLPPANVDDSYYESNMILHLIHTRGNFGVNSAASEGVWLMIGQM